MPVERNRPVPDESNVDVALFTRLMEGPLTVWAVLREDTYETIFGDGYYAYVAFAHLSADSAMHTAANTTEEQTRWHVRRYDLAADGSGGCTIRPVPTEGEPTTVAGIAAALRRSGLI